MNLHVLDAARGRAFDRLMSAQAGGSEAAVAAAQKEFDAASEMYHDAKLPSEDKVILKGLDAGETAAYQKLRNEVSMSRYFAAAVIGGAVSGAERTLNQHLGIGEDKFPLDLLAPRTFQNATTDTDVGVTQQSWVDRLFSESGAMHLGISFRPVSPGITAVPVTTAGAAAARRGRADTTDDAAWTVGVTTIEPGRSSVRGVFSGVDADRLMGLEDALTRDLRQALMEGVDRAIFLGDTGAGEDAADIPGLVAQTGVTDLTLTQANNKKGPPTLKAFLERVDGKHATRAEDLGVVATVGSNTLWGGTYLGSPVTDATTIAAFLMAAGVTWITRGDLETATTAGKWGAFISGRRNIEGAAVAAVWNQGQLIRDPYSGASKDEVALTLTYRWGIAYPRPSHFARLKYAA